MNIVRLDNPRKEYAWGSRCSLQTLLGEPPDGRPLAEIWMGAHPASPSLLPDGRALSEVDVRERGAVSFLFKFLSAERALSIQAHPSREQAEEGFAREEAAGIPLDARERTFRDRNHKPEIIVALEPFQGMSGFRPLEDALASLVAAGVLPEEAAHGDSCADRASGASEQGGGDPAPAAPIRSLQELLSAVLALPRSHVEYVLSRPPFAGIGPPPERCSGEVTDEVRNGWVAELFRQYGPDPGVFAPLFLNVVYLEPGEGLYQSAGVLHAYLRGTGVELMAESDNVVRAGLTEKYVNAEMLGSIGSFTSAAPQRVQPRSVDCDDEIVRPSIVKPGGDGPALLVYDTPVDDFRLYRLDFERRRQAADVDEAAGADQATGEFDCGGAPCIVACVSGTVRLESMEAVAADSFDADAEVDAEVDAADTGSLPGGESNAIQLSPGQSAFVPASVSRFRASGSGSVFIATTGANARARTADSPGRATNNPGRATNNPGQATNNPGQAPPAPGPTEA